MIEKLTNYFEIIDDNGVIEGGSENTINHVWASMVEGKYDFSHLKPGRKGDLRLVKVLQVIR